MGLKEGPLLELHQDFPKRLDHILKTPLSPENVNTYADDALNKLIHLCSDVVRAYAYQSNSNFSKIGDMEDAAFSHFGLLSIDETLTHIAGLSAELRSLDSTIENAKGRRDIILPPDSEVMQQILPGNGGFEKKKLIPRLKTLLFVLKKDFDIDVNDENQLRLQTGVLKDTMVRQTSYAMVEVLPLEHTIFVCDEEGNATYVFHNPTMEEHNLTVENLVGMKKSELNELLSKIPKLGNRIVYTDRFVTNIQSALQGNMHKVNSNTDSKNAEYLRPPAPPAPEGHLSMKSIAQKLGVDEQTVEKAIEALGEKLGSTKLYKFGTKLAQGYSPEQIEKIKQQLEASGKLNPPAPEGHLSMKSIAQKLGVSGQTVEKAIEALGEKLGSTKLYKFGTNLTQGYSPEQIEKIKQQLEASGKLNPPAPEGHLSIYNIAQKLGVGGQTVEKAIEALGEKLGSTKLYKFGTNLAQGYSPEQIEKIKQQLEASGKLNPPAPEGHLSIYNIAQKLGVDGQTVEKAIEALGEKLGSTKLYKFGKKLAQGYSPEQIEKIKQQLEASGKLNPPAPEGHLSINNIAQKLGVDGQTVEKAIEALGEKLGSTKLYKFGTNLTQGYSPEQIEKIKQQLEASGKLNPPAPEGHLSMKSIAQKLGVDGQTVEKAIEALGEKLGSTKLYKFGTNLTQGYSPEQIEKIKQQLEASGKLNPPAPEGHLSIYNIAQKLGVSGQTVKKAIEALGEKLGSTKLYKFGTNLTQGYSPEQIEKIAQYIKNKSL